MKTIIQRTTKASVTVKKKKVGEIKEGFVVLVGFGKGDGEKEIQKMIDKILHLRIMKDTEGKMNRSIQEVKGELLIIPQFTLYADTTNRRPSFSDALEAIQAEKLFEKLVEKLMESGLNVQKGIFGADMKVELINDGPVTILLEV